MQTSRSFIFSLLVVIFIQNMTSNKYYKKLQHGVVYLSMQILARYFVRIWLLFCFLFDSMLTLVCVSENFKAEISHLSAPTSTQHPSISTLPSGDLQHPEHSLISSRAHTPVRTSLPDNRPGVLHPQISSSVNILASWPYFMGAPTRAPPFFCTSSGAYQQTRSFQDFVGFQPQRRSSPNVPPSRHLQDANIPAQDSLHTFPFGHGKSSQIASSQTATNFHSYPVHPDCSIGMSPLVQPAAFIPGTSYSLLPQAQVTRSAASYSLLPPSNSMHNLPSSSLQVTFSDAHHVPQRLGCYRQHPQPPSVLVPPPSVFLSSHPHSFVGQNQPTNQAQFASCEFAHHGQLHPSSIHTAACDPQGASFPPFHPPSTVSGVSHPMPRSTPSGPFPTFPPTWSDCRNPNFPFHVVASPGVHNISAPTQVGVNLSAIPRVRSHDASSDNRHSTMQPPETKRRRTAGEIFSRTCFVVR